MDRKNLEFKGAVYSSRAFAAEIIAGWPVVNAGEAWREPNRAQLFRQTGAETFPM